MEITPPAVGVHRFDRDDSEVSSLSPQQEVRALVEGQFLSRRLHAERLGYSISETRPPPLTPPSVHPSVFPSSICPFIFLIYLFFY
ncbi:xylulose kinase-like [Plectropomus leopardus]|uniref:xylulose kinase-like n=1 Tax=Plectropomus leopardus TaxID=160734 RepID=UPI001C4AAD29|nr:xylulose kinase-like [Plectropomus leopardus]